MKGAVTAVTQSYIFVPRTVNIHEDICLEFYADVERCTRHKGCNYKSYNSEKIVLLCYCTYSCLVIEKYTDIYDA